MPEPKIIEGNLFASERQTLVNTVNCDGVMGAGIARGFRFRYPKMFDRYVDHCRNGRLTVGKLWLYKTPPSERRPWVLNFPTKKHWKNPSKVSYLHEGLKKFVSTYRECGIESIAFPTLGSSHGKIPEEVSIEIMIEHLRHVDIDVDIYRYDPSAEDDLYGKLKQELKQYSEAGFADRTGLGVGRVTCLSHAVENPEICTIDQLASQKGIGEKTLKKVFAALISDGPVLRSQRLSRSDRKPIAQPMQFDFVGNLDDGSKHYERPARR